MRPAINTPHPPLHCGVKYNPVRRIHPLFRHASRRTHPGFSAVFAAEKRSEEHTSELQSQSNLVCRLLLEKKKKTINDIANNISCKLEVFLLADWYLLQLT